VRQFKHWTSLKVHHCFSADAVVSVHHCTVAGCDRTFATCQSKFGNSLNFGGFPWIPVKNPFAGDSIV
jgi:hypothetical protein